MTDNCPRCTSVSPAQVPGGYGCPACGWHWYSYPWVSHRPDLRPREPPTTVTEPQNSEPANPEPPKQNMRLVDTGSSGPDGWHGTELYLKCPRLPVLNERLEGTDRAPLIKGTMVHMAIGQHYAQKLEPNGGWASPAQAIESIRNDGPIQVEWADRVLEACDAYAQEYRHETLQPLAVEKLQEVTWKAGDTTYRYCQSVDLIVKYRGYVWYVDHKTTWRLPRFERKVMGGYRMSGQMLGYHFLGRARFGRQFGGVLLNFISMPKTGDIEFQRCVHEAPEGAIRDFKRTVMLARKRREAYADVPVFQRPGNWASCFGRWGACDHADICARGFQ